MIELSIVVLNFRATSPEKTRNIIQKTMTCKLNEKKKNTQKNIR